MVTQDLVPDQKHSFEDEQEETMSSAHSTRSATTASTFIESSDFVPGKSLFINAKGIGVFRLPVPSSELQIPIYNNDGTLAYLSTRDKRCSGNSILSNAKGEGVISTSYFFGPGRDPVLRLLGPAEDPATEIKTTSKWTSRSHTFTTPDGRSFEWSYRKGKTPEGKKAVLLVLYEKSGGKRVAQLVRNDETRTPGSSKSSAGNGGELALGQDAEKVLDEALIVASCLMMLKKEVDRRRMVQMMVIAGAAGS